MTVHRYIERQLMSLSLFRNRPLLFSEKSRRTKFKMKETKREHDHLQINRLEHYRGQGSILF